MSWLNTKIEVPRRYLVVSGLVLFSFAAGWYFASRSATERHARTLAMVRTMVQAHARNSTNTVPIPALASVMLTEAQGGYDAQLEFEVAYESGTGYSARELGKAASFEDALHRWGFMEWREDGLHVGRGTNEFFVPQSEFGRGR